MSAVELKKAESSGESSPSIQQYKEARENRRKSIPIMRLHHSALRTDDMEATRAFYEDVLGLPMVHTMKMAVDPTTGKVDPFLHCFFEMADGGMIAFFHCPLRVKAPLVPQDALDFHFAMKVATFDDLIAIRKRFADRNYPTCGINHGFCYSLYVRDPNKMLVEIVADPAEELEINERFVATAHRDWEAWKTGDDSSNEDNYDAVFYPLPTSPLEEMVRVMPAERP